LLLQLRLQFCTPFPVGFFGDVSGAELVIERYDGIHDLFGGFTGRFFASFIILILGLSAVPQEERSTRAATAADSLLFVILFLLQG